jgi:hypothetical protein
MAITVDKQVVKAFFDNLYPGKGLFDTLSDNMIAVSITTGSIKFKKGIMVVQNVQIKMNTVLAVAGGKLDAQTLSSLSYKFLEEIDSIIGNIDGIDIEKYQMTIGDYPPSQASGSSPIESLLHPKTTVKAALSSDFIDSIQEAKTLGVAIKGVTNMSIYYTAILSEQHKLKIAIKVTSNYNVSMRAAVDNISIYNYLELQSFAFNKSGNYYSTHLSCTNMSECIKLIGAFYALLGTKVGDLKRLAINQLLELNGIKWVKQ